MKNFFNSLYVERLKIKRTLALPVALLAPLLIALIQLMMIFNMNSVPWEGASAWTWMLKSAGSIWALFIYPMIIAVITAMLADLEHTNGGWKRIFALPVSRLSITTAKLLWAHLLLALSNLALAIFLLAVGALGNLIKPEFGFAGAIPFAEYFASALKFYLASGLVISFHYWLANRYASFTLSMGIGIAGTFIGMMQAKGLFQKVFPWKLMINTQSAITSVPEIALILGILGGLTLAALAIWHISRRDVI